ncbi:MAG: Tex-like N-terminal domain-containing protein, partial [Bacilli bacterium]
MEENNYINELLLKQISVEQKITVPQIKAVLKLIEDGGTVPFIARYRKEVTGNLDEDQIRAINQHWEYGQKLAQRKEDIMRLIEEKGKLTDEIKFSIINANKLSELEDIYRPYKEKKKTRATDAKAKGLEPLAEYLLSFPKEGDVLEEAKKYITLNPTEEQINNKLVVKNEKEALDGAKDIVAEQVSDVAKYRKWLRSFLERKSAIVTKVKDESLDKEKVFEMYYDYQEPVSEIKNHRILAIDRGESIKILKVNIVEDTERVYKFFYKKVIGMDNESSITAEYVKSAIEDAYSRLIKPSVEREVRATLKEKAEDSAIFVFGENLRKYLLTPPMKGKVVLGLDPAFRTGCKLAVIDNTGKFIFKDKIDPHQHYLVEHVPESREELAAKKLKETILKYKCEVVAMGNGTASRESEAFVVKCLKEMKDDLKKAKLDVQYIIVNEAGA